MVLLETGAWCSELARTGGLDLRKQTLVLACRRGRGRQPQDREVFWCWVAEANEGERRRFGERVPQAPLWQGFLETGARWSEMTTLDIHAFRPSGPASPAAGPGP